MAEEASLPPNWEEVHDPEGRSYWWNVETNETTWMRPTNVVAKKSIAAGACPRWLKLPPVVCEPGYLAKVQEAEKQVASPKVLKSSVKKDLPPVISTGTGAAAYGLAVLAVPCWLSDGAVTTMNVCGGRSCKLDEEVRVLHNRQRPFRQAAPTGPPCRRPQLVNAHSGRRCAYKRMCVRLVVQTHAHAHALAPTPIPSRPQGHAQPPRRPLLPPSACSADVQRCASVVLSAHRECYFFSLSPSFDPPYSPIPLEYAQRNSACWRLRAGSGCGSPAAAARLSDSAATSAGGAPLCHLCPPPPPSSPETASVPLSACLADAPCAHTGRCLDLPYGRALYTCLLTRVGRARASVHAPRAPHAPRAAAWPSRSHRVCARVARSRGVAAWSGQEQRPIGERAQKVPGARACAHVAAHLSLALYALVLRPPSPSLYTRAGGLRTSVPAPLGAGGEVATP
eukprot:675144-Pleurochrysis_carterae.AAC.4